ILFAAFSEYLKFKEKQTQLGASTEDLERSVGKLTKKLEERNLELERRVQNLEAIVTSQTWDELHQLPESGHTARPVLNLGEPEEPTDAERAEQLAKRIRH